MKKILLSFLIVALFSTPVFAIEHSKTHRVKMSYNKETGVAHYFPDLIRIRLGDTVEWINLGKEFHSVTADAGPKGAELFASPSLGGVGQTWSYTFTEEGTFTYHCRKHIAEGMLGTIIVGMASPVETMGGSAQHFHDYGPSDHHNNSTIELGDPRGDIEKKERAQNSGHNRAHSH